MDFIMLGMNPTSNDMRLVLTWGPNPSDFDSEVKFFDINGNVICRTYWADKTSCVDSFGETYMHLDVDETSGGTNGPETITVSNVPNGVTAMYYIYDYSQNVGMGSMSFSDSEGQSTIYGPNGSGHISVGLADDKTSGGETYFIVGCFDNSGFSGFTSVGQTRPDSSLYCPGLTASPAANGCQDMWIGDGHCDDDNNNAGCGYDGGDCCGDSTEVDTAYCSICACLDPGYFVAVTDTYQVVSSCEYSYQGDGYCDDGNNNADCSYDGGDCCGNNVLTNYCSLCQCLDPWYVTYELATETYVQSGQYVNFHVITATDNTGIANTLVTCTTSNGGYWTGYTDSSGYVHLGPFSVGEYVTVEVARSGYDTLVQSFVCSSSMDFMMLGMNPTSNEMRLVLTWGPNPSDFDSEVKFFDEYGNVVCRTYYADKTSCVDEYGATYMHLDVDEVNGGTNGP